MTSRTGCWRSCSLEHRALCVTWRGCGLSVVPVGQQSNVVLSTGQQSQVQNTGPEFSKAWGESSQVNPVAFIRWGLFSQSLEADCPPPPPAGQTAGPASQQNYISAPDLDLCYWDQGYNQPAVSYFNQDGPDSQSSGLQVSRAQRVRGSGGQGVRALGGGAVASFNMWFCMRSHQWLVLVWLWAVCVWGAGCCGLLTSVFIIHRAIDGEVLDGTWLTARI